MSEADGRRLDHVVLPRRLPGLALLERYFPSPTDAQLDAELTAFARPGDTVLDPWAGTGWTARRGTAHGMRVVASDPSPFAQLAAQAFLLAPDPAVLDAAFGQLAASRKVDVPLRQHLEELYATRCAACRRPVVGEQFIWPRDGDAPGRKIYRCPSCEVQVGGPVDRVAPIDETDLAKLGIEHPPAPAAGLPAIDPAADEEELPPAPVGLTGTPATDPEPDRPLGEAGGPPPPATDPPARRFASTVRPDPAPPQAVADPRQAPHYQALRDRFPVLDGRSELVEELLDLYTPRNLYALQTIAAKIEMEFREPALASFFRLALAACLLPASRLNGYPGRVASLRISAGQVRQPASRHQREVNVWRLFEASVADLRTAVGAVGKDRRPVRFAADLDELGGLGAANVLWIRSRPAVVGQYLPSHGIDLVLGSVAPGASVDELSFEYLATAWLMGREAAETLRLEPLFSSAASHSDGSEATALRHAMASSAGALKPGGWFSVIVEGEDVDRLLAVSLAAASAELELVDVIPRESVRSGNGVTLHFRKPGADARLREAVEPRPLRLGVEGGRLTYPELAEAIERAAIGLLRGRGEPASQLRLACALLVELETSGLLRRLSLARNESDGHEPGASPAAEGSAGEPAERAERVGPALLGGLLREELARTDHPSLLQLGDEAHPSWWLREPELAEAPLADRVEWATFSVLTTAGKLDEDAFLERIFALFPGLASPDEELVRACLSAYAVVGEGGVLRSEEDHVRRGDDHARAIGLLVDYAHRIGLKAWVSRREHDRPYADATLGARLRDDERRAYLPLVVRAPAELLGAVDVIWYRRGRLAFLFEVEWTAMLGEPVLRRGAAIPVGPEQARFLVFPGERTELLRLKLDRSPWLRAEVEKQNWHFLKWEHLEALSRRESANLAWLEPMLGLDPLVERGGEQLTMFGE
ncbi:MAG TPA: hypothetical protein VJA85_00235 [Candidatus Limnocylindria bacterium]|nr:hypothetical protein [Candidatus Limnocylindria bacterium]